MLPQMYRNRIHIAEPARDMLKSLPLFYVDILSLETAISWGSYNSLLAVLWR